MKETVSPHTILSHYQISGQLGAGGMGEVYLAEDTQLGRKSKEARAMLADIYSWFTEGFKTAEVGPPDDEQ